MQFESAIKESSLQKKFEQLLSKKFSNLQPTIKWNQTMWQMDGNLIVALVFLSNKVKICFFNNYEVELDKLQRWSASIFSQNLEFDSKSEVDWDEITMLIDDTIRNQAFAT